MIRRRPFIDSGAGLFSGTSGNPSLPRWLGNRPDMVVRFGRAPKMPQSLRRPVQAVLA